MKRALDVLDQIQVASPCPASWEAMAGDDRMRFCASCSKHVYRLEGMSRAEILGLLQKAEGDVCVRLARRRDGTLITNDCPVGAERARRRRRMAFLLACLPLTLVGSLTAWTLRPRTSPTSENFSPPPQTSLERLEELWDETLTFVGLRTPTPKVLLMGACPPPPALMGKLASPPGPSK